MDVTIEARLNNIEKEQEGVFQSTILFFPTTTEDVQAALRRIEVDGVNYKKVMLSDVNIDAQHVFYPVWEAKHIDELNYLAHRLNELTEADLTVFMAVVECSERPLSAKDMINISMNLDCYEYSFGVSDDWELGRRLAEDDERLYFPPDVGNMSPSTMRAMPVIYGSKATAGLRRSGIWSKSPRSLSSTIMGRWTYRGSSASLPIRSLRSGSSLQLFRCRPPRMPKNGRRLHRRLRTTTDSRFGTLCPEAVIS